MRIPNVYLCYIRNNAVRVKSFHAFITGKKLFTLKWNLFLLWLLTYTVEMIYSTCRFPFPQTIHPLFPVALLMHSQQNQSPSGICSKGGLKQ